MENIIINDSNLNNNEIQKNGNKVRAVLLSDNKILVSHYGRVILLPGGSIDKGETADEGKRKSIQRRQWKKVWLLSVVVSH